MILRTPPQRKRRADTDIAGGGGGAYIVETPVSDRRLVIYEDPPPPVPTSSEPSDEFVCTYHCRQMVKSEFILALNTAEKQVVEYQAKMEALNTQVLKSEEERRKFQDKSTLLEQELEAVKGREQALQERLLHETDQFHDRYREQLKKISELEVELKKEIDTRKAAELSEESLRDTVRELETKLKSLSESSEREKNSLKRELSYFRDNSDLSLSRATADFERMTLRAESAEEEAELLREQLEELTEQFNECVKQKSEMEQELLLNSAASFHSSPSDDQKLIKLLQEEIRNYENEVQEAKRLKSSHSNIELLKEQLLEEHGRRERTQLELSKLQEVEAKYHKLELELVSWKSLLKEIPDVSSYADIPLKFAQLQTEALENMSKNGEIRARVKELEMKLEYADINRQTAESESAISKEKAEKSNLESKRLQILLASVSEERDRLRRERCTSNNKTGLVEDSLIKDLEAALTEKDQIVREMESGLHKQREIISRQQTELKLMNEKLSDEARKIKSLEREGDCLRREIALLESKIGLGDYSASNTKVLRMVNTLAVDHEAKQTIETLQTELKKTKERLQALEELKGQSDAGKMIDESTPELLVQLKGKIAVLEKREERYKAVFAEKISVFRRACCSLFGYKIVMDDQQRPNGIPVTRFTLQSIYAQSDDEKIEFEYESGTTNITVNDYTSQPEIAQQIEIFIRKMNSIPAFTANLTIESFNKRTLS